MNRSELLGNKEYWIIQFQNDLFGSMEDYMKNNKLNRSQLAKKFNVTKGYITQVLNGDFDHKLSKFVELALASGKAPLINLVDLAEYIEDDEKDIHYCLTKHPNPKTHDTYSFSLPSKKIDAFDKGANLMMWSNAISYETEVTN